MTKKFVISETGQFPAEYKVLRLDEDESIIYIVMIHQILFLIFEIFSKEKIYSVLSKSFNFVKDL